MKNIKPMKNISMNFKVKLFIVFFSFIIISPLCFANTIKIEKPSCAYITHIPAGWDTIPEVILHDRFGKDIIDIGIFNKNNETYFEGEHIEYIFIPTAKSLNNFSFKQIAKDLKGNISHTDNQLSVDSIQLFTNNITVLEEQNCFYISGTIKSNVNEVNFSQGIILTKFGFLKIIYYSSLQKKKDDNDVFIQNIVANTLIDEDFIYTEPLASKLTILHFILAFSIGLVVYVIIQYAPKLKQLLSKNSL